MSERGARSGHLPDAYDPQALANDWETICRSELAAAAVDREAHETWQAWLAIWTLAAGAMFPQPESPAGDRNRAAADAAFRPAAADAASDARDAEIVRLSARVAELERRLAATARPTLDG